MDTTQQQQNDNDLIMAYTPLARKIAKRYARHQQDVDDLVQAAMTGLIQAAASPSRDRARPFGPWARKYILGAVQDAAFTMYSHVVGIPERQRGDRELAKISEDALWTGDPAGHDDTGRPRIVGDLLASRGPSPLSEAIRQQERERDAAQRAAYDQRALALLRGWSVRDQKIVVSRHRLEDVGVALGVINPAAATWETTTMYFDRDGMHHVIIAPGMWTGTESKDPTVPWAREVGAVGPIGTVARRLIAWPLPHTVTGMARKLGLVRQTIYDILDRFEKGMES